MISKLPLELILEILSHMDLEQLLSLIAAYPVLQNYTVIITDLPITKLKGSRTPRQFENQFARPSIEQLFPNVDRYHFNQKDQVIPHKHIKIFDLCDPCIQNGSYYYSAFTHTHSCLTLIAMSFPDGENIQHGICYIPMGIALGTLVNRLTFVYSERTVSHRIHGQLKELRWKTGCKIQLDALSCLSHLQRKTRVSKSMRFTSQKWLGLRELHLEHPDRIELGDLHSNIVLVSVTFTREGRETCAPLFSIESSPKLQTLIIKYFGEYVPVISVKNAYNTDHIGYGDSEPIIVDCEIYTYDTFRLIRVCDTNKVLPVSHTNQMENYAGDLSFLQRCTFISLIGVPDWFVIMHCPFSIMRDLHWERIDPTPMPQSMDSYRLICPGLYVIYIRTVIPHDQLPMIVNTVEERENPEDYRGNCTLDLTIEAPGFNLNELLINLEPFEIISIRAYPFRKEILRNEPALTINKDDTKFWRKGNSILRVSGDIYLKFLEEDPLPSDLYWEIINSEGEGLEGVDLDISRTAAMNHGEVSMNWFAPHYGTSNETIRLRSTAKQEVSVNLVTSTEMDNESIGKEFLIDKEITKVFIDGLQAVIPEVSPHCKHHCNTTWVFRKEIMTYEPCRSSCMNWSREECGCDHLSKRRQ